MNGQPHLLAYGAFVSELAPWNWFVTLTHDARRLEEVGHTRVGIQRHRSLLRRYVLDCVRKLDPTSAWWSEMELHKSGQPHEHALVYLSDVAPWLGMRHRWYDLTGFAQFRPIRERESVARYVGKYGAKVGAYPPFVAGLGLGSRESFAQVLRDHTDYPLMVQRRVNELAAQLGLGRGAAGRMRRLLQEQQSTEAIADVDVAEVGDRPTLSP